MADVGNELESLFEGGTPDTVEPVVENTVVTPESQTQFVVPDKFKGKSVEDVIESYVNLEKESGRRANELGEMRKLTDHILQQKPEAPVVAVEPVIPVAFDDFVEDPTAAVNKVVADNPRIAALEASLNTQNSNAAHDKLKAAHADVDEVVASDGFGKWVQEDPSRFANFQRAHRDLDIGTATDLLSLYKQTRKATNEEAQTELNAVAASELKSAVVETGSVPSTTKRSYTRGQLIELKMHNPAKYSANIDEIMSAYAEGRVSN